MARVSKERTKEIRDQLKKEFPNLKLSVTMKDYCEIRVAIMAGNIDFSSFLIEEGSCYNAENFAYSVREAKKGYLQINHRYLNEWTGVAKDILTKITEIGAKGSYNRNANDPTADYCNMTFYFHLSLGQWNKPYIYTPKAEVIEVKEPIDGHKPVKIRSGRKVRKMKQIKLKDTTKLIFRCDLCPFVDVIFEICYCKILRKSFTRFSGIYSDCLLEDAPEPIKGEK